MLNSNYFSKFGSAFEVLGDFLIKATVMVGIFLMVFGVISGNAQYGSDACRNESEISLAQIISPASYTPLIPEECSYAGGQVQALPLKYLPYMAFRAYGFLSSLGFYLMAFAITYGGIRWLYAGYVGEEEVTKAKTIIKNAFIGMITILLAYVIAIEIAGVLGARSIIENEENIQGLFN
jgi:hypothetical protein